jgi:hypothetical protein
MEGKYPEAQKIIEDEIKNIREKIEILKIYGPKILKSKNTKSQEIEVKNRSDRLMKHVIEITNQVIRIACGDKVSPEFAYRSD